MNVATRTRLDVIPLSKHIGAEIRGIDLRAPVDPDTIRDIYQTWLDHAVLVFRNQNFTQQDLLRVTEYFGETAPLTRPPKFFPKGYARLLPNISPRVGDSFPATSRRRVSSCFRPGHQPAAAPI